MATKRAVGLMLAYLHELYPSRQPITEATLEAWMDAFSDIADDNAMMGAAKRCATEPERKFFPTPGEIRAYLPQPPKPSATEVLRRITALGHEGPHFEWVLPTVERVRGALGEVVASAYGHVGPHRLTSDNPLTREIAERDFAEALDGARAVNKAPEDGLLALPAPEGAPALNAGEPAPEVEPRGVGEWVNGAVDAWYAQRAAVSKRVQPPESA